MLDDDQEFETLVATAQGAGATVGAAESLTGGLMGAKLAAVVGAGDVFKGAIVSYDRTIKHRLLGVPPGPVVSEVAARTMALNVRQLLECDFSVALTGVAGPDEQDGQPVGSLFVAVGHPDDRVTTQRLQLSGTPDEIRQESARQAAIALTAAMRNGAAT